MRVFSIRYLHVSHCPRKVQLKKLVKNYSKSEQRLYMVPKPKIIHYPLKKNKKNLIFPVILGINRNVEIESAKIYFFLDTF